MSRQLFKVYEKKPGQVARLVAAYYDFKKAVAVSRKRNRYLLFQGSDPKSLVIR